MHLYLTDRLYCPRCGPSFGLILLAHQVRERRVFDGDLGCSNCRGTYTVRSGFADLRLPPAPPLPAPASTTGPVESEEPLRLAALMGITEGPGTLLVTGPSARHAPGIAALVEGVEVVGLDLGLAGIEESDGFSRMAAGPGIPFFQGTFQGIVLSGKVGGGEVEEAARVLASGRRMVVLECSPEASEKVRELGLEVMLEEAGVLVARLGESRSVPLVTLRGL